jgi:GDPmannose 4,6-dehydratase
MYLVLQQSRGDDFVIATGKTHSISDLLDTAFERLELDWEKFVKVDERYFRPTEVDILMGDASKAKRILGWEAEIGFEEMVHELVDSKVKFLKS